MVCPGAGGGRRAISSPKNELQYYAVSCKNVGRLPITDAAQGRDGSHWIAKALGCKRGKRLKATGMDVIIVRDKIAGQRTHIFPSSMRNSPVTEAQKNPAAFDGVRYRLFDPIDGIGRGNRLADAAGADHLDQLS
jgi:hypothetical protein